MYVCRALFLFSWEQSVRLYNMCATDYEVAALGSAVAMNLEVALSSSNEQGTLNTIVTEGAALARTVVSCCLPNENAAFEAIEVQGDVFQSHARRNADAETHLSAPNLNHYIMPFWWVSHREEKESKLIPDIPLGLSVVRHSDSAASKSTRKNMTGKKPATPSAKEQFEFGPRSHILDTDQQLAFGVLAPEHYLVAKDVFARISPNGFRNGGRAASYYSLMLDLKVVLI
jgi:hypothetical protein